MLLDGGGPGAQSKLRLMSGIERADVVVADVVVVGLGPAGSSAAARAASIGLRVIALERKPQPGVPVQCAEFVPAMLDQACSGLDAITAQRIKGMLTFVEGTGPDLAQDFQGRMIDRAAFDSDLAQRAAEAGAECRYGTGVRHIEANGTVDLSDGSRLEPRVLIGADGPRSIVGRRIGNVNKAFVESRQITVRLLDNGPSTEIFLGADMPGGYGWLFPKGTLANLGIGVAPAERGRLKPLLGALHARLIAEGRLEKEILASTGGAIPAGGMVPLRGQLAMAPVLLAGDAAGLANPVTGAGIAAAVYSGTLAGEAAAAWLGGDQDALEDYEDEIEELFSASLTRALRRRAEVLSAYHGNGQKPDMAALKRGWVGYSQYWAGQALELAPG